MKIKTKTIELPTFEQLTEDEQKKVIENYHNINTDYGLDTEDLSTIASFFGVTDFKLYFSGFHSQGDGACFEGRFEYIKGNYKKLVEYAPLDKELHAIHKDYQKAQKACFYSAYGYIKQSGHYMHSGCTSFSVYSSKSDNYINDEIENNIIKVFRDLMNNFYKKLNNDYDYLTSDEAIKETLINNEYTFNRETLKIDS